MADKHFDAVVIGAGPGGYVCAIRLGQLGKKVAVIERDNLGGVCLNVGCIPSKAMINAANTYEKTQHVSEMGISFDSVELDLEKLLNWKNSVVKKLTGGVGQLLKANKVEVIKGEASFVSNTEISVEASGSKQSISADNFVIAVGSSPIEIPGFEFDEKDIVSSTGALDISSPVKSLAVIGGGYIGLEIGTYMAKFGTQVTIIEAMDRLLPSYDLDVAQTVLRALKKRGVKVISGAKAKSLAKKDDGYELSIEVDGDHAHVKAEKVLVTVGRFPNKMAGLENTDVQLDERGFFSVNERLQTNVPGIYAIGDVAGQPMLAHKASKEGLVAAAVIGGDQNAVYDVKAMPAVIFCEPEVATVGMSELDAKKARIETMVGVFPFAALGKSLATGESDGFCKIIGEKDSGRMIGAAIVGHEASAMIAECALGIEAGLQVEDFALTVHAHPTISEATMEAAEVALGHAVHMVPKRPRK